MATSDSFFVTYEAPPPFKTQGFKDVEDFYTRMTSPTVTEKAEEETEQEEKPVRWIPKPSTWQPRISQPIDLSERIVSLARQQIGKKYTWAGNNPSTGFDCSGLIHYVFKENGIDLPRTVKEIEHTGSEVSLNDVRPGDLICLSSTGPSGKHIKLVSRVNNGQIYTIEAKGKHDGIVESLLTDQDKITTIRRVMTSNIIDYFMSKGLTKNQAASIYGNIMQESNGNYRAKSSDGSYGLAQWRGSRKQKLFQMYGENPTEQQQLDFLWWELNNTHKGALQALRDTETVDNATRVFMSEFERPNAKYANLNRRLRYAQSV